ncbi:ribosome-binding factor A [Dictyobacter vulcani]|uniref:Ribosome-binding factor A n=1 Tax=Dictyobacter vulcani TaxID=2607529 RepID=A0A5J4KST4_9CHLR|nr:30S ribosome-binding factor RbfA [Dictyobacter vulcani]GER89169.1 ribosome-binding factor A [Dictyobacter vulcani]
MPNSHRQEKLGELMTADLSELIRTRVKDPRVGFASITRVEVSGDLRHARVFVSVMGTPEEQAETMKGLRNASGYLRHELATRLTLRYMPDLSFKLDTSIEEGARILGLISRVEQEDRERAARLEEQEKATNLAEQEKASSIKEVE